MPPPSGGTRPGASTTRTSERRSRTYGRYELGLTDGAKCIDDAIAVDRIAFGRANAGGVEVGVRPSAAYVITADGQATSTADLRRIFSTLAGSMVRPPCLRSRFPSSLTIKAVLAAEDAATSSPSRPSRSTSSRRWVADLGADPMGVFRATPVTPAVAEILAANEASEDETDTNPMARFTRSDDRPRWPHPTQGIRLGRQ